MKVICCCRDSFAFSNDILVFPSISDRYFANSPNAKEGENSRILCNFTRFEDDVEGIINENRMLASAINFIVYTILAFLNIAAEPSFTFFPNSTVQPIKPDSFSSLNLSNNASLTANFLAFSSIHLRMNADQFISGNCFIFLRISSGTDNVTDTMIPVSKRKYV